MRHFDHFSALGLDRRIDVALRVKDEFPTVHCLASGIDDVFDLARGQCRRPQVLVHLSNRSIAAKVDGTCAR